MADTRTPAERHPTLYAVGVGGLIGGLLSCFTIGWWGLLVAFVLFFGSALVSSIQDGYEEHLNRKS